MIHVRETFEDEGHEQTHEDIHAEYIPRYEQRSSPRCASAVTVEEVVRVINAIGGDNLCKILHDVVPTLSTAHAKEKDKRLGNIAEIQIAGLLASKPGKSEYLRQSNCVDQEQHEPGRQKVCNGCETGRSSLEKLVKLIVARDEK